MNFVGAFLILNLGVHTATGDDFLAAEEDAFWMLSATAEEVLPGYWGPKLAGLMIDQKVRAASDKTPSDNVQATHRGHPCRGPSGREGGPMFRDL